MAITVAPTQSDINAALRAFLLAILPAGTPVVMGQVNRVPEPAAADFVVMWPLRRRRIETNITEEEDVAFTASIAGTLMTVTDVQVGTIPVGALVYGTGLAAGTTTITGTVGSSGGTGAYLVSPSQVAASQQMAAGGRSILQPTEITMQLDVHGPASSNNAQIISTLMRDGFAVEFFAGLGTDVVPLYADDPRQMPFINAEQQYETRWVVEALLQANQAVSVPQQYADAIDVTLVSVDATYPP